MSPFDLRNDLAVQAAKNLDAQIEVAMRAAFDDGMDFVRSAKLELEAPNPFAIRDIFTPQRHVVSYKGGPIGPGEATPAGMVRYARPKRWRKGQGLR